MIEILAASVVSSGIFLVLCLATLVFAKHKEEHFYGGILIGLFVCVVIAVLSGAPISGIILAGLCGSAITWSAMVISLHKGG